MATKVAREQIFQKAHVIRHHFRLAIWWNTWFKNLSSQFSDLDCPIFKKSYQSHWFFVDFTMVEFRLYFKKLLIYIGGTQTLFRDLTKCSNIGIFFRSSSSASKIVPSHEIWAHGPIPESKKRIGQFKFWDWEKYHLKLVFWKTLDAIDISV